MQVILTYFRNALVLGLIDSFSHLHKYSKSTFKKKHLSLLLCKATLIVPQAENSCTYVHRRLMHFLVGNVNFVAYEGGSR